MMMLKDVLLMFGRGIGQVMLQRNALSGLLMLAGIAVASWKMAVLALAGNIIGTLTAYVLGYRCDHLRDGLYGFNGVLVGIAVGAFMPLTAGSMLLLIVGACGSVPVARLFERQSLVPGLTAPFIIVVWILLALCALLLPDLLLPMEKMAKVEQPDVWRALCLGVGQVMFQGNTVWAGLLMLAGVAVNSRVQALYAIMGTLLPVLLVLPLTSDYAAMNAGLMGYNGVLCAIALGNNTWCGALRAAAAVVLSVLVQAAGMHFGIVTLTAPFVLAVWAFKWRVKNGE